MAVHLEKWKLYFYFFCVGSQRGTRNVGLGKADPRFIEEVSSGKEATGHQSSPVPGASGGEGWPVVVVSYQVTTYLYVEPSYAKISLHRPESQWLRERLRLRREEWKEGI